VNLERALQVIGAALKMIRCLTGSRCRETIKGVICVLRGVPVATLANLFCTFCSLYISLQFFLIVLMLREKFHDLVDMSMMRRLKWQTAVLLLKKLMVNHMLLSMLLILFRVAQNYDMITREEICHGEQMYVLFCA